MNMVPGLTTAGARWTSVASAGTRVMTSNVRCRPPKFACSKGSNAWTTPPVHAQPFPIASRTFAADLNLNWAVRDSARPQPIVEARTAGNAAFCRN